MSKKTVGEDGKTQECRYADQGCFHEAMAVLPEEDEDGNEQYDREQESIYDLTRQGELWPERAIISHQGEFRPAQIHGIPGIFMGEIRGQLTNTPGSSWRDGRCVNKDTQKVNLPGHVVSFL